MEKTKKGERKVSVMKVSLARKAWLNITLFLLASAVIVFGFYLSTQPEWTIRNDIKLYNQGVSAYLLPIEVLPATDDRPSEYSIVRAAAYFQQAALESTDSRLQTLALYNLGTLMGKDALTSTSESTPWFGASEAVNKLAEAVRVDPDNEDAKYNLELLEMLQAEGTQIQWLSDVFLLYGVPAPGHYLGGVDKGY